MSLRRSKFEIRNPKQKKEAKSGFGAGDSSGPSPAFPHGPNGNLTGPNGLPNGSNFCKYLITRKVYGLTGKSPPGTLPHPYSSLNPASELSIQSMESIGFRFLAAALFCLTLPTRAATNISAGDDDLAKLRPPRAEIPPTFWERYNIWIIAGALVFLGLIGIIVWIVTRPKPPVIVPPEIRAKEALDSLSSKPEDGLVLSQVSQILRRYIAEAFAFPPGERTTTEFCRVIASHDRIVPELASAI